jgi:alkylation response protein AidB-like acyl-CoA dehydrogenase
LILEHRDDLNAFRAAVRQWVHETAPPEQAQARAKLKGDELVELQKWWMAERAKVGLATPHWPSEFGGADLSLKHQVIIADEFARANAPGRDLFAVSLNHLPGTLIPFGTEQQKRERLSGVSKGVVWCQGFSEPGAGSDLASLRTSAVRDGDHYVVNGQKIWSSYSMYAEYCILLARTDPAAPKHKGISYFLLDMKSPGVEVRPIKKSSGDSLFGEIFLDDVRIPVSDLVGEENQGWAVAQATLSSERGVLTFESFERHRVWLDDFFSSAVASKAAWLEDDQLRREFMSLFARQQSIRRQIRHLLRADEGAGGPRQSLAPALLKLQGSTVRQQLAELAVRIAGLRGQLEQTADEGAMHRYLDSYALTIAGGSNEIMRNLIAERGMGMPR